MTELEGWTPWDEGWLGYHDPDPESIDEVLGAVGEADVKEIEALTRALLMEDADFGGPDTEELLFPAEIALGKDEDPGDGGPDGFSYEDPRDYDVATVFLDPVELTPRDYHAAAVTRSLRATWGHPEVVRCHMPVHKRTTPEGQVVLAAILDSLGLVPLEATPRFITVMTAPDLTWRPGMEKGLFMGLAMAAPCLAEGSRLDIEVPCRVTVGPDTVDILATHSFYLGANHGFKTYEPDVRWAGERRRGPAMPIRRDLAGRPGAEALWEEA